MEDLRVKRANHISTSYTIDGLLGLHTSSAKKEVSEEGKAEAEDTIQHNTEQLHGKQPSCST